MDGYMEDCKEFIEAREDAQNKIELLTIAINKNEISSLFEKKTDLQESLKSALESKNEYVEKL